MSMNEILHSAFLGLVFMVVVLGFAGAVYASASIYCRRRDKELQRQQGELDEAARRREAKHQQLGKEQRIAAQSALALRLSSLVDESVRTAKSLPELMRSADVSIDRAELEFEDGAFAPFWDAIEEAANRLASFEATVQRLIQNSHKYSAESPNLETTPPPFRVGLVALPDATYTAKRMGAVVRRAQKDYHFASIYEQRKTNQLLVVGFSSLGQAICELGDRLDLSLERLASAVSIAITDLSADIAFSHDKMTAAVTSELQLSRDQAAADSSAQREHENKELEMLDNIQRRRKPLPQNIRDGEY